MEMIASQDHPLVLSSGIHHGTHAVVSCSVTGEDGWGDFHLAPHGAFSGDGGGRSPPWVKIRGRLSHLKASK